MKIRKVTGGYIVEDESTLDEQIFLSLEEVFTYLLFKFEGRCPEFAGDSFGIVAINRTHLDLGLSKTFSAGSFDIDEATGD